MKLLKKELQLAMHPTSILFLLLSAMVLIPNYPYYVVFFYTSLSVFFVCLNGRENHDITYSLLLPVRKADVVKGRFLFVTLLECFQVVVIVPFMVIKQYLPIEPNVVGMEANIALLGMGLFMFGLFNVIFFSVYYKNPNKVGKAFLLGSVSEAVCMVAAETLVHAVPAFRDYIDTMGMEYMPYKLIVFAVGAVGYILLTLVSYKRAQRCFEGIDFFTI